MSARVVAVEHHDVDRVGERLGKPRRKLEAGESGGHRRGSRGIYSIDLGLQERPTDLGRSLPRSAAKNVGALTFSPSGEWLYWIGGSGAVKAYRPEDQSVVTAGSASRINVLDLAAG